MKDPVDLHGEVIKKFQKVLYASIAVLCLWLPLAILLFTGPEKIIQPVRVHADITPAIPVSNDVWHAPDSTFVPSGEEGDLIYYGKKLIASTAIYLGPSGKVKQISNGMNCQNCHLDAGTKPFGNNYSAVASTYPKFRARSGSVETIEKRINDCIERSLNGIALSKNSREMKAITSYIKWVGSQVPKGKTPEGAGLVNLTFLDRPASPVKGKNLYADKCSVCHGKSGEGVMNNEGNGWTYPPLWGDQSYNNGAGLYRLSRFAGYIKANMPFGATYKSPMLTDEEAWDIAAFVNSQQRPVKNLSADWPDIKGKPFDHPFGPFADSFREEQHKFGPFKPIIDSKKK